jgi:hypothetical protein
MPWLQGWTLSQMLPKVQQMADLFAVLLRPLHDFTAC